MKHLQGWEATLRLEALLAIEIEESTDGGATQNQPPASDELALLLAKRAQLCFVIMGDNLAYDNSGKNIITLTSSDAAALCANAYGQKKVRAVKTEELLDMAEKVDRTAGYSLTVGPDQALYNPEAGQKHIPKWHSRVVSAAWMADTLKRGLSLD